MLPRERLTAKELQVATLVWEGLTNREIGKPECPYGFPLGHASLSP